MRLAATVLLLPVVLTSLAPAAPVPNHLMPKTPPFYHPTAPGTKWVYERAGVEETHILTAVETEQNGAQVIVIKLVTAEGRTKPLRQLRVTAREWCMTEEVGNPYTPAWPLLKLPINEDHKWDYNISRTDLGAALKGTKTQGAKTELLKTPAGTFEAAKVETRDDGGGGKVTATHWYASGIGLIQIDNPPCLVLKTFTAGKGDVRD